ncbi:MAG: sulfatase [Armatimonadetes bacterium]|nr:sulfatase [Armatimonadota bacterium]
MKSVIPQEECAGVATVTQRSKPGRWFVLVLLLGVIAAACVWRPWANSLAQAAITVKTEGAPPQILYETSKLFRESARGRPTYRAQLDLTPWAGKLALIEFVGRTSRRELQSGDTGFVAFEANLVTGEGTEPIEFVGWQQGRQRGLHSGALGPRAGRLEGEDAGRFAFATKGTLWFVLRVPEQARLEVRLRPVPSSQIESKPRPYVPETAAIPQVSLPGRKPERPPDVFIYLIDALRADHLGCYGYDRPTSPQIDAFAREATLFEEAHTPTTWTRPAVASLLTGLYAMVHGAMHWSDGLAEWPYLMPEILREGGYETYGFVTNANITATMGFDQGWDQYVFRQGSGHWVNEMLASRLEEGGSPKPLFAYCHIVEPHAPYSPGPEAKRQFDRGILGRCDGSLSALEKAGVIHPKLDAQDIEHLIDLYDAEVWEGDRAFGEFITLLQWAGRYEDSLIILVADHGEAFAEHDTLQHAWDLNQETLRVPLIVRFPQGRWAGERVRERASLLDLLPTVLGETGVSTDLPYRLPGLDLARFASASEEAPTRVIYGETSRWDSNDVDLVAVIDSDGWKRVIDVSVPPQETAAQSSLGLWNTRTDTRECDDALQDQPVRAAYEEQLLARWLVEQYRWRESSAHESPPQVSLDEAIRRELQALGYVGTPTNKQGE